MAEIRSKADYEKYLPSEFLKLLRNGTVRAEAWDVFAPFNEYITRNYPWVRVSQSAIDWDKVDNAIRLNIEGASKEQIRTFVGATTLRGFDEFGLVYSREKPCFVLPINIFLEEFDLVTGITVNLGYFIGISKQGNTPKYHFETFIEYAWHSGLWLSGISRDKK